MQLFLSIYSIHIYLIFLMSQDCLTNMLLSSSRRHLGKKANKKIVFCSFSFSLMAELESEKVT